MNSVVQLKAHDVFSHQEFSALATDPILLALDELAEQREVLLGQLFDLETRMRKLERRK